MKITWENMVEDNFTTSKITIKKISVTISFREFSILGIDNSYKLVRRVKNSGNYMYIPLKSLMWKEGHFIFTNLISNLEREREREFFDGIRNFTD